MMTPTYWTGQPIQPGDWVRVYSSRFGVWHHGIVRNLFLVADGIGVEIIHNMKDTGVSLSDWYEFAAGNLIHLHGRPSSPEHALEIVRRAEANTGNSYGLFDQNCEHFCSFCYTLKAESESLQVLGWMAVGTAVVIGLTASNRQQ